MASLSATGLSASTADGGHTSPIRIKTTLIGTSIDMLDILEEAGETPAFYWEHPDGGQAILGIGAAAVVETAGRGRLDAASAEAQRLLDRIESESDDENAPAPVLVGGFSFGDDVDTPAWYGFAPCRFVLPQTTWLFRMGQAWRMEVTQIDDPGPAQGEAVAPPSPSRQEVDSESDAHWESRFAHGIELIESGEIKKVVLSRSTSVDLGDDFDAISALRSLRAGRPSCVTFCIKPGRTAFIGSTPEMLLHVEGGQLKTQALAGTTAHGTDQEQESERAAALLASTKDRREHHEVVGFLRSRLEKICGAIITDRDPSVVRYPEAMHLRTRLHARLKDDLDALALAAVLHPTPAVCGAPQARAAEILTEEESDRGWYTGAVGWLDTAGTGSLAVALRSALLADNHLTLWAGAGIVAGSDSAAERAEIELKLDAIRMHLEQASK